MLRSSLGFTLLVYVVVEALSAGIGLPRITDGEEIANITLRSMDKVIASELTRVASIRIAVYITSCVALIFLIICCFYCCKHFCFDGCRNEPAMTYRQFAPSAVRSDSIRNWMNDVRNAQDSGNSFVPEPLPPSPDDTNITSIPLRGMKRVKFATPEDITSPTRRRTASPPPPPYEYYGISGDI